MAPRSIPVLTVLTVQLLDTVSSVVADLQAQLPERPKASIEKSLLAACRELQAQIVARKRLGGLVSVPSTELEELASDTSAQALLVANVRRLLAGGSSSSGSSSPPVPPPSGGGTLDG